MYIVNFGYLFRELFYVFVVRGDLVWRGDGEALTKPSFGCTGIQKKVAALAKMV